MGCGSSRADEKVVKSAAISAISSLGVKQYMASAKSGVGTGSCLAAHTYGKVNQNALNLNVYYKNQTPPSSCKEFSDNIFPHDNNSLLGKYADGSFTDPSETRRRGYDLSVDPSDVIWCRAKEIFPEGEFAVFDGKIEVDDIKQGSLGDCYFLSSLAALSEHPHLIAQIFRTTTKQENGLYQVLMKINGELKIVLVDDYFPCTIENEQPKPVFCKPKGAEIWAMLLEKAWAKVNKGYLNIIGGFATEVLGTLTDFPVESLSISEYSGKNSNKSFGDLWGEIKDADSKGYVISTNSNGCNNEESNGIVAGHAFTLISVHEGNVAGGYVRLVRLRNPRGFREWTGDWSDNSPKWTTQAKKVFNSNDKSIDDGSSGLVSKIMRKYLS